MCVTYVYSTVFSQVQCAQSALLNKDSKTEMSCDTTGYSSAKPTGRFRGCKEEEIPAHSMPAFLSWIIPQHCVCTLCLWLSMHGKTMPRNLLDNSLTKGIDFTNQELWTQSRRGCWEENYCADNTFGSYVQILNVFNFILRLFPSVTAKKDEGTLHRNV